MRYYLAGFFHIHLTWQFPGKIIADYKNLIRNTEIGFFKPLAVFNRTVNVGFLWQKYTSFFARSVPGTDFVRDVFSLSYSFLQKIYFHTAITSQLLLFFSIISLAITIPATEACIKPRVMPAPSPPAYKLATFVSRYLLTCSLEE